MKMMFGLATNKPEPNKIPHHQLQPSCLNMIVLTLCSPPLSQTLVLIAQARGQTPWCEQKMISKVHSLCRNVTWHLSHVELTRAPQDIWIFVNSFCCLSHEYFAVFIELNSHLNTGNTNIPAGAQPRLSANSYWVTLWHSPPPAIYITSDSSCSQLFALQLLYYIQELCSWI